MYYNVRRYKRRNVIIIKISKTRTRILYYPWETQCVSRVKVYSIKGVSKGDSAPSPEKFPLESIRNTNIYLWFPLRPTFLTKTLVKGHVEHFVCTLTKIVYFETNSGLKLYYLFSKN